MRLHSAVSWPKSEARTEGEMMARGMVVAVEETNRTHSRSRLSELMTLRRLLGSRGGAQTPAGHRVIKGL